MKLLHHEPELAENGLAPHCPQHWNEENKMIGHTHT